MDISEDDIKPTPELGNDIKTDFIRNVATSDERMVMLLDIMLLLDVSAIDAAIVRSTENSKPLTNDSK